MVSPWVLVVVFSSRRRHTRFDCDWSSDVCSSDLAAILDCRFGRSDNRESLRRFFEVDAECIAIAVLWRLAQRGEIRAQLVERALKELEIGRASCRERV